MTCDEIGRYILFIFPFAHSYLELMAQMFNGLGAILMDGGVETSASYLQTFIMALL